MDILGHLGIDFKLLLAQGFNFALLVWLLNKFLYRPIIHRLEKDEKQLKEAEEVRQQLLIDKKKALKTEKELSARSREQAEEIVEHAKEIAKAVQRQASQERDKQLSRQKSELAQELVSEKKRWQRKWQDSFQNRLKTSFKAHLGKVFSRLEKKRLASFFFDQLLAKLNLIDKDEFTSSSAKAVLYSALAFGKKEKERLEDLLTSKLGQKAEIDLRRDSGLISGFRLEAFGVIIESSLADKIEKAFTND